jgi:DNA mismatch repair protein MSH6
LRQLNIDKDIFSMKNFNIYDPMKQGKGLVLDGQTLAHIEVIPSPYNVFTLPVFILFPPQILVNSEGTADGSLLKLLGRCITPFGTLCLTLG